MNRILPVTLLLLAIPGAVLAERWIEDKVVFQVPDAGTAEFSHYVHLDALGKNCTACHNRLYNVETAKNKTLTMAEMEKGKGCGSCHNGQRAFSVKGDCTSCHMAPEKTFVVEDAGNVLFSHEAHTAMFGCSECHPDLFKAGKGNKRQTMSAMEGGASCGACHDGSTAFSVAEDCESCHEM